MNSRDLQVSPASYSSGCGVAALLLHCVRSQSLQRLNPSQPLSYRRIRAFDPPSERSSTARAAARVWRLHSSTSPLKARRKKTTTHTAERSRPIRPAPRRPARPVSPAPAPPPGRVNRPAPGPPGGDAPAVQDRRERRPGPRYPRRRRHHFRSRDGPGPLGRERPGQALDRQHHQGDDGAGVPRGQSRSRRRRSPSSAATSTRPRRPISARTTGLRSTMCCT